MHLCFVLVARNIISRRNSGAKRHGQGETRSPLGGRQRDVFFLRPTVHNSMTATTQDGRLPSLCAPCVRGTYACFYFGFVVFFPFLCFLKDKQNNTPCGGRGAPRTVHYFRLNLLPHTHTHTHTCIHTIRCTKHCNCPDPVASGGGEK